MLDALLFMFLSDPRMSYIFVELSDRNEVKPSALSVNCMRARVLRFYSD